MIISLCLILSSSIDNNNNNRMFSFVTGFTNTAVTSRRQTTTVTTNLHQQSHDAIKMNRGVTFTTTGTSSTTTTALFVNRGNKQISNERRKQLGLPDDADEYDLDKALENNTDPLITKIIAGSFIITIIALLVVGVIIPYTTIYDDGICNPIANGGRCV